MFHDGILKSCETFFPKKSVNDFGSYPINYVHFAYYIADEVIFQSGLMKLNHPKIRVVIEETCAGRNNYSQKMLEFIHLEVIRGLNQKEIPMYYIRTGVWRKKVGANLNAQEKLFNKNIAAIKRKTKSKLAKINGKVVGKLTRKHAALRCFKEHFGYEMPLKLNDAAEAALIGLAFIKGVSLCDGKLMGGTGV